MALSLNYDVLGHILHYCSTSTLNNHCLVSSQFRLLAIPHLLHDIVNTHESNSDRHSGVLDVGRHVVSLRLLKSAFFIVDKYGGRTNTLSGPGIFFGKCLELMPNIRSIVIAAKVEDIASLSDDFGRSILSRPLLTDLELCDVGPITSLALGPETDLESIARKRIGRFLMHSKETLEEIHFDSSVMHNLLAHGDVTSDEPRLIFPNVNTVSLRMCDVRLDTLAKSFPALASIFLDIDLPANWIINAAQFSNLVSFQGHYFNITKFLQSDGSCPRLRRLVIDDLFDHTPVRDPTIEQASPWLKSLHVNHRADGQKVLAWWRVVVLASPSITFLALSFDGIATDSSYPSILCIQLPHLLASMPLLYISLTFESHVHVKVQDLISEYEVAVSFAANVKTLEYINVLLKTTYIDVLLEARQSWWKISRTEGNLPDNEATIAVDMIDEEEGVKVRDCYDWGVSRK
ncbi:hypothetical protein CPB84DRAFT_1784169 [Gymnopilus junonius]|uniref:F-box domain-containing protein n=1 Tax=Gymnopilus junonius TaxID=109634 RepID=A0A9P5TK80_GYMJU|nr:hypothetical protein CPB84DRAFT_1784169 [Gymnopilus junonius]